MTENGGPNGVGAKAIAAFAGMFAFGAFLLRGDGALYVQITGIVVMIVGILGIVGTLLMHYRPSLCDKIERHVP